MCRAKRCLESRLSRVLERRERPAETQDGVRTSFSGHHISERRWGGRGTGAVKATGSYEGSLSVEDTSGCHEPSPFTRRWSRQPWRLPHAGERHGSQEPKLEGVAKALRRSCGRGRGDRGVRGSIGFAGAVGVKRPRSELTHAVERRCAAATRQDGSAWPVTIRRSVLECRETLGPPGNRTEPKTPWGVHAVKVA